jgi:hypothetical protein
MGIEIFNSEEQVLQLFNIPTKSKANGNKDKLNNVN